MKILRNQDGIALVISLMFTLICLGMIMTLMYFVMAANRSSGAHARYVSTVEASYGAVDFMAKTIIPRVFANNSSVGKGSLMGDFGSSSGYALDLTQGHLIEKINNPTASWGGLARKTFDPKVSPDAVFTLPGMNGNQDYKVYSKITDTVPGVGMIDSSGVDFLDGGLGVAGTGSSTQTQRTPYLYTVEVLAERAKTKEKANLTVLYAY
jgi:hypothetical protein